MMGYFKNKAIELEEDRRQQMTFYIEKVAREVITGLELDKPGSPEEHSISAYLLVQRILQRNLDELFKVLFEEKEIVNENVHREEEEIQESTTSR